MDGGAAERTRTMKFVTGVTATVYRYNPAIVAQAFASLDASYNGRIGLGVGSGEAMNEVSVGLNGLQVTFAWKEQESLLKLSKVYGTAKQVG